MDKFLSYVTLVDQYILWDDPLFRNYYIAFLVAVMTFLFLSFKLARTKETVDDGAGFLGSDVDPSTSVTPPAPVPAPATTAQAPTPSPLPVAPTPTDGRIEDLTQKLRALESDQRKDPLYLDPLMKRLHALEQKVAELAARPVEGVKAEDLSALKQSVESSLLDMKSKSSSTDVVKIEDLAALRVIVEGVHAEMKKDLQEASAAMEKKLSAGAHGDNKHSVSEAEFRVWRENMEANTFERLQNFEKALAQAAGVTPTEFRALSVKVDGLQKILEHIAEDPGSKHP
jgi:hypothetical protein